MNVATAEGKLLVDVATLLEVLLVEVGAGALMEEVMVSLLVEMTLVGVTSAVVNEPTSSELDGVKTAVLNRLDSGKLLDDDFISIVLLGEADSEAAEKLAWDDELGSVVGVDVVSGKEVEEAVLSDNEETEDAGGDDGLHGLARLLPSSDAVTTKL